MRKHIVFIMGSYGTYMSPGANIVSKVRDALEKDPELKITTIAHKEHFSDNGIAGEENLILLQDTGTCIHHLCQDKIRTERGVKRVFYKLLLSCKKVVHFAGMLVRRYGYSNVLKRKTFKLLEEIHKQNKIDVLIPCGEPHDAVFAGLSFKKKYPDTIFLPYQLDRFANGNSLYKVPKLQKGLKERNLRKEEEVLTYADVVYVLKPILPHYQSERFAAYQNKIVPTEHPMLVPHADVQMKGNSKQAMDIVYAGSLDKKLRNPTTWLEILLHVKNMGVLAVQNKMFSFGNCEDILKHYEKELGDYFVNAGKIPYEKVVEEYQKADFILTIGNHSTEEVPSKIFDCISYGKPMIHLYHCEEDPCIPYLKDYPYALCLPLSTDAVADNANRLIAFCETYCGKKVDFTTVESIFKECTPKYVADMFLEQM